MNAADQLALAQALSAALEQAGILIERPQTAAGNVRAWVSVPAVEVIGLLARRGWKVSLVSGDLNVRALHLVREGKEL